MSHEEEAAGDEKIYSRNNFIKKYKKVLFIKKFEVKKKIYPELSIINLSFTR